MKYSATLGAMISHMMHKHSSNADRTRDLLAPLLNLNMGFDRIEEVIANKNPMQTDKAHVAQIALSNDRCLASTTLAGLATIRMAA